MSIDTVVIILVAIVGLLVGAYSAYIYIETRKKYHDQYVKLLEQRRQLEEQADRERREQAEREEREQREATRSKHYEDYLRRKR